MKNLLLGIILWGACSFMGYGQGYQKSFGKVDGTAFTDQQELYDICNNDLESVLVAGTFRNFSTFPEIAFYGTVSKLNKTGTVAWYKGYLPADFVSMEAFLITSVFKAENGDTYCLGWDAGYILMKLNAAGEVLFAKKIEGQDLEMHPKALFMDGFIYAKIQDKVVKFDLNGEIVEAKIFEHLSFRDIHSDQNGNIILTGEYLDYDPNSAIGMGCPVLTLDADLQLVSGNVYSTDPFETGFFYGQSIISTQTNQIIVGGPGGSYFCANPDGEIAWANLIPQFGTGIVADGYNGFWDLQRSADGTIVGVLAGFFSNEDGIFEPLDTNDDEGYFQNYSAICKIDPATGLVISSKDIREGHFDVVNHLEVNNLLLDNDTIYAGGNTVDYNLQYKLNYIHKTDLNDLGCGEEPRAFTVESWSDEILPVAAYQADLIADADLFISDIEMIAVDIPINYEDQSCSETTVNVDEPSLINEIVMYPNPVDAILTIDSDMPIVGMKAIDILGKEMPVRRLSETEYDFSGLRTGVYIVQVRDGNGVVNRRVVKK